MSSHVSIFPDCNVLYEYASRLDRVGAMMHVCRPWFHNDDSDGGGGGGGGCGRHDKYVLAMEMNGMRMASGAGGAGRLGRRDATLSTPDPTWTTRGTSCPPSAPLSCPSSECLYRKWRTFTDVDPYRVQHVNNRFFSPVLRVFWNSRKARSHRKPFRQRGRTWRRPATKVGSSMHRHRHKHKHKVHLRDAWSVRCSGGQWAARASVACSLLPCKYTTV